MTTRLTNHHNVVFLVSLSYYQTICCTSEFQSNSSEHLFQIEELPLSIGKLKNLEELIISQNFLEHLPPSIGLCRKLHTLNVDDNDLVRIMMFVFDSVVRRHEAIFSVHFWTTFSRVRLYREIIS